MNVRLSVLSAAVAIVTLASAVPARADTPPELEPPPPPPIDQARPNRPRDHVEMTMGFLGGQRTYTGLAFNLDSSSPAAQVPGASKLTAPFTLPPYDRVNMVGLRYEARVHIAYARMTAGFDLPFSVYNQTGTSGMYDVGGTMRTVTVQSLSSKEAHFGLGAEVPIGRFVPFVDLLGGVHWVSTDVLVDQTKGTWSSTSFAMSVRGGARIYMRRWFFAQVAGEAGLIGDLKWNAELSVGAALPW